MAQGERVLRAAGFGFAIDLLPIGVVLQLARIPLAHARMIVTRILAFWTKSAEFVAELCALVEISPNLSWRGRYIRAGYTNHCRRDYISSIRTLLPEVEGIMAQAMELDGKVIIKNRKIYALRRDGTSDQTRGHRGKLEPHELKGLDQLVDHSGYHRNPDLAGTADHIKTWTAPDRNPIQHGQYMGYETAKRSTQALLLVMVLALRVGELEAAGGAATEAPLELDALDDLAAPIR